MRKVLAISLVLFLMVAGAGFSSSKTFASSTAVWTINSLISIGCNPSDTGFSTTVSGATGAEYWRTIVEAGGLRYMDEVVGPAGNSDWVWHLYPSSSGGPTTGTWPLPPNTPIVVHFMLIKGAGGPIVYETIANLSQCNGGTLSFGGLGPDMVDLSGAVVGSFVTSTPVYFAPNASAATTTVMDAGKTAYVFGKDASGNFYKVELSGQFFWVPVGAMGPNYDNVWNGAPLPTTVVN